MTTPWLPRQIQRALLTAVIAALVANLAGDAYHFAKGTVRELAHVPELVPAAQGTVRLTVVPESRRSERRRFLFFFGRTYYLTTYRVSIENQNALPPVAGRLVVRCRRGGVAAFEGHPLLDPAAAPGGPDSLRWHAPRYRDATEQFVIDLNLPPPTAEVSAELTVVASGSFVAESDLTVELGYPGGVLSAEPVEALWTCVK